MTYVITVIILVLILLILFKLYNKDILSPSVVYTFSMIGCLLCAIIGLLNWNNVSSLKLTTILIITLSVVFFSIGEFIVRKLFKIDDTKFKSKKISQIDWWKIIFQIVFIVITIILMYFEVKRIAKIAGYTDGGIFTMINYFRNLSILYTTELLDKGQGINLIVSQMRKICEVMCYVNIYFLMNNIFFQNIKNKKNLGYLLIVFLNILLALLTGGRMQIVIYIIAAVFILLVLLQSKYNYVEIIKKHSKKIAFLVVFIIIGFYVMLPLTGRKNNVDIVSYMSFYLGASIPSLDIYLDNPTEPETFGEETLRGFQMVLYKIGINKKISPISTQWINFNVDDTNIMSSNIFTSGKRYYHDFGFIGIIICQFIFGFSMSLIYYMMKRKSSVILLIFLSMFFYMIIDQIRDDLFYSNFVHINSVFYFIVLIVGYYILTKFDFNDLKKIKFRKEMK